MKKANGNKALLLVGLFFVIAAFGCVAAVLYQVLKLDQQKTEEVRAVQEEIVSIDAQRAAAEQEAQDLARRVGREIEMDRLIEAAHEKYGPQEQARSEGDLWIDRAGGKWMITLGALNGIEPGRRLRVLGDSDVRLGVVVAETVLDVVSYVYPLEDRGQYQEDIYRVVPE